MADVSGITAVKPTSDTALETEITYGETVAAGETVYLKDDGKYWLARNATLAEAAAVGIAVTPGAADEPGIVALDGGVILVGATLAVGENYVVSSNSGKIAVESDLASTHYCTSLGRASSATQLNLSISASGIQHA